MHTYAYKCLRISGIFLIYFIVLCLIYLLFAKLLFNRLHDSDTAEVAVVPLRGESDIRFAHRDERRARELLDMLEPQQPHTLCLSRRLEDRRGGFTTLAMKQVKHLEACCFLLIYYRVFDFQF